MADDCLFQIIGTGSYIDCFWIAAVSVGLLLGQFIILAPLIKPTVTTTLDMWKEIIERQRNQANDQQEDEQQAYDQQIDEDDQKNASHSNQLEIGLLSQQRETHQEMQRLLASFWKDYQKEFKVFGFNFSGYIIIITIACFFVTLGTVFLIYSVDDPRQTWKSQGWKKSIHASTMLIVIVGGANNFMLGTTKKTIEKVLVYYKATKVTNLFHLVYWISLLTPMVFFCSAALLSVHIQLIYFIWFIGFLSAALSTAVSIGVVISCGACCTLCCAIVILYWVFSSLFSCLLCPLRCCMNEEKREFITNMTAFSVTYVVLLYGLMVAVIVIVFLVTDGIDNTDFCIRDNVKSWIALIWLQFGPIIGAIGMIYKFCNYVQSNQGSMELKDEYK